MSMKGNPGVYNSITARQTPQSACVNMKPSPVRRSDA